MKSIPTWVIGLVVFVFLIVVGLSIYFLVSKSSSPQSDSPGTQPESASSTPTPTPGQTKPTGALYTSAADQQSIINQCLAKLGPGDNPAMCGTVRKVV
jgi:flagellar basal body-associated protein FliL